MAKTSKIDTFKETLALAKEERAIPAHPTARLFNHEQRITKHLATIDTSFFEIGKELAEIQAEGEYPEKSFKAYVKRRWNKTRSWGYQMIEGYQTKAALPESVQNFVQNQGQAAAIAKAPKAKRAAILKEVAAEGKVTAAKITEKIETKEAEFRVVVKDFNDEEVPEPIAAEFQRAEREAKEQIANAQQIKNYLEHDDITTVEARALRETVKDLLAGLKTHLTKHVLCPVCHGGKCKVCSKRGFVSNHFATKGIGKQ